MVFKSDNKFCVMSDYIILRKNIFVPTFHDRSIDYNVFFVFQLLFNRSLERKHDFPLNLFFQVFGKKILAPESIFKSKYKICHQNMRQEYTFTNRITVFICKTFMN